MISRVLGSVNVPSDTDWLTVIDPKLTQEPTGPTGPTEESVTKKPAYLTRFPYQKGKPAPKGHKYNLTHGLTPILNHSRFKRRRAIDTRFTEGKEAMAFRDSLIAMKGGADELTPTLLAVVDVLTAKYYRLLRVYRYLYKQPPPPVIDEKKRRISPLWKQVDGMEDSLLSAAKQYGFAREVRQISLHELLTTSADNSADDGKGES
jgi:hypothetical protein